MYKKMTLLILVQFFYFSLVAQITEPDNPDDWGTIEFAGETWQVKDGLYSPGPNVENHFSADNVTVDGEGLHLKITEDNGVWYCAEVQTEEYAKYGTYIFDMVLNPGIPVDQLDPNITIGTFFYEEVNEKEFDIEFASWGVPNEENNTECSLHCPPEGPVKSELFGTHPTTNRFRTFISWTPDQILYKVFSITDEGIEGEWKLYGEWNFNSENEDGVFDPLYIPTEEENFRVHINFYIQDAIPPTNNSEAELIITNYKYITWEPVDHMSNYQQDAVMIFSSEFFIDEDDEEPVWTGNNTQMVNFCKNDLNRNAIYISTDPLNTDKYDDSFFDEMADFVETARNAGLKVYAIPIASKSKWLPENHSNALYSLDKEFKPYQLWAPTNAKFDGAYFDIEPWASPEWDEAEDDPRDWELLHTYTGNYLDLITLIRNWYTTNFNDISFFLAFATNQHWHKWSLPEYGLDDPTFDEFPNGDINMFLIHGATCVVPQVYQSSSSNNWSREYDYDWFNKDSDYGKRWEYFNYGNGVLMNFSAYNPIYTSRWKFLVDEAVISDSFTSMYRSYFGSVLYGYGAAKYTKWRFDRNDPNHDIKFDNTLGPKNKEQPIKIQQPIITISPNPVEKQLNISYDFENDYSAKIISKYGEVLISIENQKSINVEHLPSGIYYLILIQGDKKHSIMFSKK